MPQSRTANVHIPVCSVRTQSKYTHNIWTQYHHTHTYTHTWIYTYKCTHTYMSAAAVCIFLFFSFLLPLIGFVSFLVSPLLIWHSVWWWIIRWIWLFKIIQEQSGTDWKEMYKVFNMGHRMELYASPQHADEIISIATSFNIDAKVIGRVEQSTSAKVTLKTPHGEMVYE